LYVFQQDQVRERSQERVKSTFLDEAGNYLRFSAGAIPGAALRSDVGGTQFDRAIPPVIDVGFFPGD
jgi:hypothetical protein